MNGLGNFSKSRNYVAGPAGEIDDPGRSFNGTLSRKSSRMVTFSNKKNA
jgi:hypothetical protein